MERIWTEKKIPLAGEILHEQKINWHLLQSSILWVSDSPWFDLTSWSLFCHGLMTFGFKYMLSSGDFTPFLAIIPVLISVVPLTYSTSEWCQRDLLKPKFHRFLLLIPLWSFLINSQLKCSMSLGRAERIFIIWASQLPFSNEKIGNQSSKKARARHH